MDSTMGSLTPDQKLRGLLTDLLDGLEPWDLLEREHAGRGPRAAVRLLAQTFRLAVVVGVRMTWPFVTHASNG
ncbi:hypothetical protein [Streptomyces sp. NPDC059757]|uniref:hypothetical protein n=1 Tax=Streptomyces sp. NPDC059757 TaxID=3346935 RepID=UPI003669984F